jgi:hypothetical protein
LLQARKNARLSRKQLVEKFRPEAEAVGALRLSGDASRTHAIEEAARSRHAVPTRAPH